ncbi:Long-chain-fatty-acid-CoA ligase [Operophtera brumata]|uniref:Long-chain-fatty-acid-CoA ligase n=1 Tax=Operophtera brumata TaxID=104452 RepID=A0A0L7L858_OPEBR|nr:Long-chain-fatty-acid-CoA ligase [Operophtera brumata]
MTEADSIVDPDSDEEPTERKDSLDVHEEDDATNGEGGESRACALTALMLHCCAAAQLAQQKADAGAAAPT